MPFLEVSEAARRQIIDVEAVFGALESAQDEARRYRGFMFWRSVRGKDYLIRAWPDSKQSSVGPRSADTEQTYSKFVAKKTEVEKRVQDLREQLDVMRRMNKALRVGRTPDIVVDILQAMRGAQIDEHFLTVGTNALYAYESAAGVRFPPDVMETRDADFLYDTRKRASFLQVMDASGHSFLDLLKKVDKTFARSESQSYTAVNSKGYQVDLIRRFPPTGPLGESTDEHPLQLTGNEDDLWVVRAKTGEKMLSAPRFDQVVVSSNGAMAKMRTIHPLHFVQVKRTLATLVDRDPRKAPKDAKQAELVQALVKQYLPHLDDWATLHRHEAQSAGGGHDGYEADADLRDRYR